jgi:hypothetical protein
MGSLATAAGKGYLGVPTFDDDEARHRRQLAIVANNLLAGKMNNTGTLTVTANAATTTLTDSTDRREQRDSAHADHGERGDGAGECLFHRVWRWKLHRQPREQRAGGSHLQVRGDRMNKEKKNGL